MLMPLQRIDHRPCAGYAAAGLCDSGKQMIKILQGVHPVLLLLVATTLEVSGDAVARMALYGHAGPTRVGLFIAAAALLFGYGLFLNLAPIDFGRVVGLYIAILFMVWQAINFVAFGTRPALPILVGGAFVIAGGAIVTFWKPA
jgi:small multidrug resistance family-3 protein